MALSAALNMARCALSKQWPLRTAVYLALKEGDRVAAGLGYPCWSATAPALFAAAWAAVTEAEENPCPKASDELLALSDCILGYLPAEDFDPSPLLPPDCLSPKANNSLDELL